MSGLGLGSETDWTENFLSLFFAAGFAEAPARLRDFALCWMFFPLASTGFLEHLTMPNRWCIINQMFANSLPVDARVKNIR